MTWNGNPAKNISSTNMLTNNVFDPSAVPLHRNRPPGPLCTCPSSPGPLCGTPVAIAFLPLGTEHNPSRKLRVSSRKLRVSKLTRGGAGGALGPGAGAGGGVGERPSPWSTPGPRPWRGLGPRQGQQAMGLGRLRGLRGTWDWDWEGECIYIYIYIYIYMKPGRGPQTMIFSD